MKEKIHWKTETHTHISTNEFVFISFSVLISNIHHSIYCIIFHLISFPFGFAHNLWSELFFIYFSIFVRLFLLSLSLSSPAFMFRSLFGFHNDEDCGCVSMLMLYFYGKKQCNKKCGHLSVHLFFSLHFSSSYFMCQC